VRGSGLGGGIGSILYSDRFAGPNPGREYFVYSPAVGHTVATLTGDTGAVAVKSTNLYEAFGNVVKLDAGTWEQTDGPTSGTSSNNRLANTKERDASIGLDNHGFRYYDPEIGRYTTRDPLRYVDGMNMYLSVHNNPINHVDPLGLINKKAMLRLARKIAAAGKKLASAKRSVRSALRRLAEHKTKLAKYAANPDLFDNKGLLKAAGKLKDRAAGAARRKSIIAGRIKHLTGEIRNQRKLAVEGQKLVAEATAELVTNKSLLKNIGGLALVMVAPRSVDIGERLRAGEKVSQEEVLMGAAKDALEAFDPVGVVETAEATVDSFVKTPGITEPATV
jgi:RHS repeat-associated protein